jgi:bifunctional non-homologous end joining protein LigD
MPRATLAFIKPSLARDAATPPLGDEWVYEIKHDGFRIEALVAPPKVQLLTRNGLDWTHRLGLVVKELAGLRVRSAIIDGEAVVQNDRGVSDPHALQRELKKGSRARIAIMAFDLLHLDGRDLWHRPLRERKDLLRDLLGKRPTSSLLQFSDHMLGNGRAVLESACKMGLEGIISKRLDRPYHSGRTLDWLKSLCLLSDPFVVIGFVPSKAGSAVVGSLVLGFYEGESLIHAGRVGTGFSQTEAQALWQGLQTIRIEDPPIYQRLSRPQRQDVIWVQPRLVAQVQYRGWSADGLLRHSSFKALLPKKQPSEVFRPASRSR